MKRYSLAMMLLVVSAVRADEPTRPAEASDAPKVRSIAATAARGIALLSSNDYEGFLREMLPPEDWRMIAGSPKLRAKILRRVKSWDDEITMQLRDVQERREADMAFNGDRTEVGTGHAEHLADGTTVSHAIALRRIGDLWYVNWVQQGQEIFTVWARDRERFHQ